VPGSGGIKHAENIAKYAQKYKLQIYDNITVNKEKKYICRTYNLHD